MDRTALPDAPPPKPDAPAPSPHRPPTLGGVRGAVLRALAVDPGNAGPPSPAAAAKLHTPPRVPRGARVPAPTFAAAGAGGEPRARRTPLARPQSAMAPASDAGTQTEKEAAEAAGATLSPLSSPAVSPPRLASRPSSASSRGLLWHAINPGRSTSPSPVPSPVATAAARAAAVAAARDRASAAAERGAAVADALASLNVEVDVLPAEWRPVAAAAARVSPTALVARAAMPPPPPRPPLSSSERTSTSSLGPLATGLCPIAEAAATGALPTLEVTLEDVRAAAAAAVARAAAARAPSNQGSDAWTLATAQSVGAERTRWWRVGGDGGSFAGALRRVTPDGRVLRKRTEEERVAARAKRGWLRRWR